MPKEVLPNDSLSNGQFDKRTFRRKYILLKGQRAENREMFGTVTRFSTMRFSTIACVKNKHYSAISNV